MGFVIPPGYVNLQLLRAVRVLSWDLFRSEDPVSGESAIMGTDLTHDTGHEFRRHKTICTTVPLNAKHRDPLAKSRRPQTRSGQAKYGYDPY